MISLPQDNSVSVNVKPALPPVWDVLRAAVNDIGVKEVARRCGVSPGLVYKWVEPAASVGGSGAHSPLSRVVVIIELLNELGRAEDARLIAQYVAQVCGGTFVPRPAPVVDVPRCLNRTVAVVSSELIRTAHEFAVRSLDGAFDREDQLELRHVWTFADACVESAMVAVEAGHFSGRA